MRPRWSARVARWVRLTQAAMRSVVSRPKATVRLLASFGDFDRGSAARLLDSFERGGSLGEAWPSGGGDLAPHKDDGDNPLREYFDANLEGPGIWKWSHYFDPYHRHLAKFRDTRVNVAEIGVYSGGSLPMWRWYFGSQSHLHGIDIESACEAYAADGISVVIGNQADRAFWSRFRAQVPALDVVIDDGGHRPEQQIVTLEELLPHLRPGGVFICEDIHGVNNAFAMYVMGLIDELNRFGDAVGNSFERDASPFQQAIHSVHLYPFMVVIEKHQRGPSSLDSLKHGTEWQPFYDR